jgi:transporter family protein
MNLYSPVWDRPGRRGAVCMSGRDLVGGDIPWLAYALLAAFAGAAVATLTKASLRAVDSDISLAVQSVLILLLSWGMVAARGRLGELKSIEPRAWGYLLAAGVVTGCSYLFLFRALKLGDASKVVPVDRLSLVFGIILAAVFLKEKVTGQVVCGAVLMSAGAVVIALAKR